MLIKNTIKFYRQIITAQDGVLRQEGLLRQDGVFLNPVFTFMHFLQTSLKLCNAKKILHAFSLIILLSLTACGNPTPPDEYICVNSDDMGDNVNKSVPYLSSTNSGWVDTKLDVEKGKKLNIQTTGSVYLCLGDNQQIERQDSSSPWVRNKDWFNSGIPIKKNYKYSFAVTGSYEWHPDGCPGHKYLDNSCVAREGKGLFAYIGNGTPSSGWFGTENQDDADEVMEMFRRDNNNAAGYYSNRTPKEGTVWFRYRDNEALGPDQNGNSREFDYNSFPNRQDWYNDNTGGYQVTITRYHPCYGSLGKFMEAKIVPEDKPVAQGTDIAIKECYKDNPASPDPTADKCSGGQYSTNNAPETGRVWLRIKDSADPVPALVDGNPVNIKLGDGIYDEYKPPVYSGNQMVSPETGSNNGNYSVVLSASKKIDPKFVNFINSVISPIRKLLLGDKAATPPTPGLAEIIYNGITNNSDFIQGIRTMLALAIVFFAFNYMGGLTNITKKELMSLMIRFSIVITIISPTSWEFFYKYLFAFFVEGTDYLIYAMSSNISELIKLNSQVSSNTVTASASSEGVFTFLNSTFVIIFSREANIKLSALLGTFPSGVFLALIIYIGIIFFLMAVVKALLGYLTSIVMVALLLALAPIFMSFYMFAKFKYIAEKWLSFLISYAFQPVLLIMMLSVFNLFIYLSLYEVLGFSACYTCMFWVDLPISEILNTMMLNFATGIDVVPNFDRFCGIYGYLPWGFDISQDTEVKLSKTPVGFLYIFIFVIFANLMVKFIDWVVTISDQIAGAPGGGGTPTPSITDPGSKAIGEATNFAKAAATTAFDGAKYAGRVADHVTNGALSNAAKKIKRTVKANMPFSSADGTRDRMGFKPPVSKELMTTDERKGYDRMLKAFDKLDAAHQQDVRAYFNDMHNDRRISGDKGDKLMQELRSYGKSSGHNTLFGSEEAKKRGVDRIDNLFDDLKGYRSAAKGTSDGDFAKMKADRRDGIQESKDKYDSKIKEDHKDRGIIRSGVARFRGIDD